MHPKYLLLLTALALALPGDIPDLLRDFTWRQALKGEFEADALHKVKVPAEVYDGSTALGRDLRIIDSAPRQWPWYLWIPTGTTQFQKLPVQRLNESMVEDVAPYLRVEMRVGGEAVRHPPARHNRITLETAGSDFIRKVEILGRASTRDEWGLLGSGFLINHSQPTPARNALIRYRETDYPYLQIRVYRNARDAEETLALHSIQSGMNRDTQGEWEDLPLAELEVPEKERKPEAQVLMLETDARHRPVERMTVDVADDEFARPVVLYGRAAATNRWRRLYGGELHRLEDHEHLRVALQNVTGSSNWRCTTTTTPPWRSARSAPKPTPATWSSKPGPPVRCTSTTGPGTWPHPVST